MRQDSIQVGYISPAWKLYTFQFQLPALDVTPRGRYHHQMSLVEGVSQWGVDIPEGVSISEVGYPGG